MNQTQITQCNVEWCQLGQLFHFWRLKNHLHERFLSALFKYCYFRWSNSPSMRVEHMLLMISHSLLMWVIYHRMKPNIVISRLLFIFFICNWSWGNMDLFGNASNIPGYINSTCRAPNQNYHLFTWKHCKCEKIKLNPKKKGGYHKKQNNIA